MRIPLLTRLVTAYAAPTLAIVATSNQGVVEAVRTLVWTLAFAVMGIACVVNAVRCGRVHCHFTGPFLLLLAAASLLHGLRVVDGLARCHVGRVHLLAVDIDRHPIGAVGIIGRSRAKRDPES